MSQFFILAIFFAFFTPIAIQALQCRCTEGNWFLQNRVPCYSGTCSIQNSNCDGSGLPNPGCFWEKVVGGTINRIEYTCGCSKNDIVWNHFF